MITRLARDPLFWAALIAGPLVVWGLAAFGWVSRSAVDEIGNHLAAQPMRVALIVVAYPVVEEWLFRGIIQPAITQRLQIKALPGISTGNFVTSLAFALAHLIRQPPALAGATFFPSLVFGFFRDRYASVIPGVLLHVWYNFIWVTSVA
jgi:uncharacterized protein